MDTTKNRRLLAAAGALALLLGACGGSSDDPDAETQPQEPSATEAATEAGASGWTEEDEAAYQAEYEQAQQYLVDNYGILDSADFCDSLAAGDTSVLADLATEAELEWDDETHLGDSGIAEAAYDWCEN